MEIPKTTNFLTVVAKLLASKLVFGVKIAMVKKTFWLRNFAKLGSFARIDKM